MQNFTIGADPEIFVKVKGKAVSAHDLIKGTKKEPFPVTGGAIQVDGLATEFNIDPVNIKDWNGFNTGVVTVMKQLHQAVKFSNRDASFMKETTADFSAEYMDSLPKDVLVLGCDPDWNAYTEKKNVSPDGAVEFRSAGGHIHLGWATDMPIDDPEYIAICADIVKVLDLFVGVPCRILDPDDRRRTMYGMAGAFRPKTYGLEYRTPSSVWIHQKVTRLAAAQGMNNAVSHLNYQKTSSKVFENFRLTEAEVRAGIDGTIQDAARVWERTRHNSSFGVAMIERALAERMK